MTPLKKKLALGLAATAAAGATLAIGLSGASPAQADPKQFDALVGFGSDTLQEVTNAFAGFSSGVNYTPLQVGPNQRQLISWDAFPDNQCISTEPGAPTFHRPNGSTEGRYFLSIVDGGGTYRSGPCGDDNIANLADFARTSSFVSTTSGPLTYVPLGRDATSFVYYAPAGVTPVTSLTRQQIFDAYTNGSITVGSTRIIPCGIQTGSGTFESWNRVVQASSSGSFPAEDAGTAECRAIPTNTDDTFGRLQESDADSLRDKGESPGMPANTQLIRGFSVANWIAQMNDVQTGQPLAVNVDFGIITTFSANKPYTFTPANPVQTRYAPETTYYNSAAGRTIGYALSTFLLSEPGELELKEMFTNGLGTGTGSPQARICRPDAQQTANSFGFLSIATCGTTTIKGSYVTPPALPLS
jgi:ABC-type phosphate transport system substrate-binding protein